MSQASTLDRPVDAAELDVDGHAATAPAPTVHRAWWLIVVGVALVVAISAFAGWTIGRSGVQDAVHTGTAVTTGGSSVHTSTTHHAAAHRSHFRSPSGVITVHTPDGATKNIRIPQ
jgi:hypothetical protein